MPCLENEKLVATYKRGLYTPTGEDYEEYIINELNSVGYNAVGTPKTGDQGADVIVELFPKVRAIVQCKYYSRSVGNTPVQEIETARKFYKACHCVAVTNQRFTEGAVELARANGVFLVPRFDIGDDITSFIYQSGLIPERYLDTILKYKNKVGLVQAQMKKLKAQNEDLQEQLSRERAMARDRLDALNMASNAAKSFKPIRVKYGK